MSTRDAMPSRNAVEAAAAGHLEDEPRCERSDLPESMCAHCRGHDGPPEKAARVGYTTTAQYPGECGHCGEPFGEGARIALAHTDTGRGTTWCIADHTQLEVPR